MTHEYKCFFQCVLLEILKLQMLGTESEIFHMSSEPQPIFSDSQVPLLNESDPGQIDFGRSEQILSSDKTLLSEFLSV